MQIGGAEIRVVSEVMMVTTIMHVVMIVMRMTMMRVRMTIVQQPGAGQVDAEPETREPDCLREIDRHRRNDARHRLVADRRSDYGQDHGAGKSRQFPHFAGTEAKTRVACVAARKAVGQCGNGERAGMR